METSTEKLIARKEGNVGWIVFNNPARHNAISYDMWKALPEVLDAYAKDNEIRAIVLKGEGEKAFVAGADISQFKDMRSTPEAVAEYNKTADDATRQLQECSKPTIAMIRGYCIGGGTSIAVSCDIRIAADDARFAVPAAKLGLGYRYVGVKRLTEIVGLAFAAEIFFTARQFSAEEALNMKLVNRVVPATELEKFTREYAGVIAGNAPLTIASVKRSILEGLKNPEDRDLALCQQMVDACFQSADYSEGQAAFKEKRKPVFNGR